MPGWRVDPGSALLLAEIIGWTGDFQSALSYYDHAIAAQGRNETLFMAHAFKGQHLYEIYTSAVAAGQRDRQKFYARQVVESFQKANAAMKHSGRLAPGFSQMLKECETFAQKEM
ncbi:MAG: hypothetical protein WEB53_11630 [Akkermansiaceae bacterium]